MCSERNVEIAVSYVRDTHDAKIAEFGGRTLMLGKWSDGSELDGTATGYRYASRRKLHGDDPNEARKSVELDSPNGVPERTADGGCRTAEGPIDLSASNSIKSEPETELTDTETAPSVKLEEAVDEERRSRLQKNRQKKRKSSTWTADEDWSLEQMSDRIPKQTVSKKEEVLKAARSLFSKRTRTLYHWMYPDTSKGKLKAIVSAAWDTLSTTEKEFYVSQVLGRFGVPAGSLMVNPQLGGFQNRELVPTDVALSVSASEPQCSSHEETACVGAWARKRWRKQVGGGDASDRQGQQFPGQQVATSDAVDASYDEDEFADDPELKTELLQFRRAMGNAD